MPTIGWEALYSSQSPGTQADGEAAASDVAACPMCAGFEASA